MKITIKATPDELKALMKKGPEEGGREIRDFAASLARELKSANRESHQVG